MEELEMNVDAQKISPSQPEGFQKHWFCVAMSPAGGSIYKTDAESPEGFLEILSQSPVAWVDYWTDNFDKEAPVAAAQLGFSDALISSLTGESRLTYQDFDTEMGIRLPSIQVHQLQVERYPLLLLIRKNFILSIHPINVDRRYRRLRRYADTFMRKIRLEACAEDKLTLLLMRLIDETNERNFEHLRQVEELGDALNKEMSNPNAPRHDLGPKIYEMKHALITYLDGLWETVDVLHALRYGDAELITDNPKLLARMALLADDVNRQIGLAEHLSEVLASGLETLQTIYNNQLQVINNRMSLVITYLTIIGTAFLVPNTLATILSGSAFNMQHDDIGWYVALLVGSTILATGGAYWWARRWGPISKPTIQ
jgi:magnesium transporter